MIQKVVIITGGSSGIGKACASLLAQKKLYQVIITGRNEDNLVKAVKEIGNQIDYVVSDVALQSDCEAMVAKVKERYGRIDILINNAGISMRALFKDLQLEVFEKVMQANFMGSVYATHACISEIIQNKGSIIAISSIAGHRGLPARTAYSASKFAMQGFFESLRTELLHSDVHVMVVCPGFTKSNIRNQALIADGSTQAESPLDEQKIMSAEEVAQHIYQGMMHKRRDLVLTFQGKLTVWLNKFFPSFLDKMVFKHFAKESNSPLKH
jgi:short-subunit dehydrogenase